MSNPELTNQVIAQKNAQHNGQGISVDDLYVNSLEARWMQLRCEGLGSLYMNIHV